MINCDKNLTIRRCVVYQLIGLRRQKSTALRFLFARKHQTRKKRWKHFVFIWRSMVERVFGRTCGVVAQYLVAPYLVLPRPIASSCIPSYCCCFMCHPSNRLHTHPSREWLIWLRMTDCVVAGRTALHEYMCLGKANAFVRHTAYRRTKDVREKNKTPIKPTSPAVCAIWSISSLQIQHDDVFFYYWLLGCWKC